MKKKEYPTHHNHILKPRERMTTYGANALSDQELLSVILGSGIKGSPVHHIAKKLLIYLDTHKDIELEEILAIQGLGQAKALSILASLELGRRIFTPRKWKIQSPKDILPLLTHYTDRDQEHFIVFTLNGANEVITHRVVSIGLLNRTLIHPREVFRNALIDKAATIIIAHNHPSGNVAPSKEDIAVTENLVAAGKILDVLILDHIVFSAHAHLSFYEENLLY